MEGKKKCCLYLFFLVLVVTLLAFGAWVSMDMQKGHGYTDDIFGEFPSFAAIAYSFVLLPLLLAEFDLFSHIRYWIVGRSKQNRLKNAFHLALSFLSGGILILYLHGLTTGWIELYFFLPIPIMTAALVLLRILFYVLVKSISALRPQCDRR